MGNFRRIIQAIAGFELSAIAHQLLVLIATAIAPEIGTSRTNKIPPCR
ncbi:hypothetical protein [Laspinema palackyanum]